MSGIALEVVRKVVGSLDSLYGSNATVTAAQVQNGSNGRGPLTFLIDGQPSLAHDCNSVGQQTVNATAGDGQIGYSVDNGVNFQFTDAFTSLTPGGYDIIVKVFGLANICEKTATATVAEGNAPITWYKDNDKDADGCTPPAGYVANLPPSGSRTTWERWSIYRKWKK